MMFLVIMKKLCMILEKMIKSKTDYQVDKNIKGDSDLIFNAKNSDT